MRIEKPERLSSKQLGDIKNLAGICSSFDNIACTPDVDESFKAPDEANTFLLYEKHRLLAYINLFAPKKTEAELSAVTLPEYRRKGLFSRLLTEVLQEMKKRGTDDILFVCDRKSAAGQSAVCSLGARYEYSEYLMKYNRQAGRRLPCPPQILIRESVPGDIEVLTRLSLLVFDDAEDDAANYIRGIFGADNRIQHVAVVDGQIAGMISTALEDGKSYIHGLCVFPEKRRKGIGRALLDYKVAESLVLHPQNAVELEVMTENGSALSIYQRSGFETSACYNYLRISCSNLSRRLSHR